MESCRFLDYVAKHDGVWICCRIDVARHRHARHSYRGASAVGGAADIGWGSNEAEHEARAARTTWKIRVLLTDGANLGRAAGAQNNA
jgi:hypothetical protein